MKPPAISEKSIERDEIHKLFCLNGWWCIKIDVLKNVKIAYERAGKVSIRKFTDYSAEEGRADLLAVRMWRDEEMRKRLPSFRLTRAGVGDVVFVEVKRKGKKSEPHQIAWKEMMQKRGHIVLSDCRSWADVKRQAKEYGIEVERR